MQWSRRMPCRKAARVLRVAVLVGVKVEIGALLVEALRRVKRAIAAFRRVRENHFGPVRLQEFLAFGARVGGHQQLARVPVARGDHGVRDAGVAAGGIEDGLARRELSRQLAGANHAIRGPILHRTAGIVPFRLGENANARELMPDAQQGNQRRVANRPQQRVGVRRRQERSLAHRQAGLSPLGIVSIQSAETRMCECKCVFTMRRAT